MSRLRYLAVAVVLLAGCQQLPPQAQAPAAPPSTVKPEPASPSQPSPSPPALPETSAAAPAPAAPAALPPSATVPADKTPPAKAVPAIPAAVATTETKPFTAQDMPWLKPAGWQDLPGWQTDDLAAAWPALLQSCQVLQRQTPWRDTCQAAAGLVHPDNETVRGFFQSRFAVYQVQQAEGGHQGLVTGYYEPLLRGSRTPTPRYRYPLFAPPEDLLVIDLANTYPELKGLRLRGRLDGNRVLPYYSRGEIDAGLAPVRGKEVAWVDDPVELFFLQVQGSGRLQLENGELMRVGYAEHNGHPYRSIGRWLVEKGELSLDRASMQGIKEWARRNPDRLAELLAANPSYVFFRELPSQDGGPLGALGVPLTAERSIAVDPRAIPLGAPVWLATSRPNSSERLARLVLAQDTGGAIKGNVRADFFWGFGDEMGRLAGAMKQSGQMWLLLPRQYPTTAAAAAAGNAMPAAAPPANHSQNGKTGL